MLTIAAISPVPTLLDATLAKPGEGEASFAPVLAALLTPSEPALPTPATARPTFRAPDAPALPEEPAAVASLVDRQLTLIELPPTGSFSPLAAAPMPESASPAPGGAPTIISDGEDASDTAPPVITSPRHAHPGIAERHERFTATSVPTPALRPTTSAEPRQDRFAPRVVPSPDQSLPAGEQVDLDGPTADEASGERRLVTDARETAERPCTPPADPVDAALPIPGPIAPAIAATPAQPVTPLSTRPAVPSMQSRTDAPGAAADPSLYPAPPGGGGMRGITAGEEARTGVENPPLPTSPLAKADEPSPLMPPPPGGGRSLGFTETNAASTTPGVPSTNRPTTPDPTRARSQRDSADLTPPAPDDAPTTPRTKAPQPAPAHASTDAPPPPPAPVPTPGTPPVPQAAPRAAATPMDGSTARPRDREPAEPAPIASRLAPSSRAAIPTATADAQRAVTMPPPSAPVSMTRSDAPSPVQTLSVATPAPEASRAPANPAPLASLQTDALRSPAPAPAPPASEVPSQRAPVTAIAPAPPIAAATILPAFQAFGAALHRAAADERRPVAREPIEFLSAAPALPASPAIGPAITPVTDPAPLDTTQPRWPEGMIARIEQLRDARADGANETDTRIRLHPDALGTIDVALRREGDAVRVHFTAAEPATRTLLADAQPRLQELAEAKGLKLGGAPVDPGNANTGERRQPASPQPATPARPRPSDAPAPDAPADTRLA